MYIHKFNQIYYLAHTYSPSQASRADGPIANRLPKQLPAPRTLDSGLTHEEIVGWWRVSVTGTLLLKSGIFAPDSEDIASLISSLEYLK